jgi:hypothetical protein
LCNRRTRIPFARQRGPSASVGTQDMLIALAARFGLAGETVGEVAAGAVLKHRARDGAPHLDGLISPLS